MSLQEVLLLTTALIAWVVYIAIAVYHNINLRSQPWVAVIAMASVGGGVVACIRIVHLILAAFWQAPQIVDVLVSLVIGVWICWSLTELIEDIVQDFSPIK
ncbi:MAG TPA: hypothetical protein VEA59_04825 [Patescibacteria group bacterium]|nr:hypothetical protein [Patescibacteria group bacterium]